MAGQIDPRGKASRVHGRLDDPWLDSVEHQLCSSEHLELIAWTDIAPGEVDESVAALALHGEASEVEDSLLLNDLDINLPARLGLICPDQLGRVAPDLNPDVNVLHRRTVGTTEHATRRVEPGDHQSHTRNDDRSTLTPAAGVWCYPSQLVLLRVLGRRFCPRELNADRGGCAGSPCANQRTIREPSGARAAGRTRRASSNGSRPPSIRRIASTGTASTAATTPNQVVRAYLIISGLFTLSASVIWGVNTLFLLDAGLDIFEVFVANASFTAGMVIFEIPTGVVADAGGRRRSFLLAAVTLLVGTVAYVAIAAAGGGLVPFVVASVVLGLGFSFYSGAVEAWLVDALDATGYEGQLDQVFARGSMVSGAAMLVGSIGGGLLGSVDLAGPFVVRAALLGAVFVVGLATMHDIGFTPHATKLAAVPSEMGRVLQASINFGWRSRSVRLIMGVALVHGAFTMWGFYAWQPYVLDLLDSDAVWITGVISAVVALATMGGNALVDFFTRFCGKRTTLLLAASAALAAATVGVGLVDTFWPAVLLFLVAMGATGVVTPVQQAYLHAVIPSSERATVVSSVSLVGSAGGIGGSLGLGYVARVQSLAAGYISGGLMTLLAIPLLLALRGRRETADLIIGQRAGKAAPCAAQGLPPVASVDTTARQPEPVS